MILFITTNLRPQPLMLEYKSHTREPGLGANFLFDPKVQRLSKYNLTIYIRAILTHAFIQKFIYYYQKTLSHRKHLLNEQNICDKEVEVLLVISQVGKHPPLLKKPKSMEMNPSLRSTKIFSRSHSTSFGNSSDSLRSGCLVCKMSKIQYFISIKY